MVLGDFVSQDIRHLFRREISRARRAVIPQAIALVHLYRNLADKPEREESASLKSERRKKLLKEVLESFTHIITKGEPLDLEFFDRWMKDQADDEVGVFQAFSAEIERSSKIEAKKSAKWKEAARKRDRVLQAFKSEKKITVEVRHLQPRLDKDIDAPTIHRVGECLMLDTFDTVLLRWIMQTKVISLRNNPHFYDNLDYPRYRLSEWREALVFSKTLSEYRATRKRAETERLIIHCITDADSQPLIIFKDIAGWRFGQLYRLLKNVIVLKGPSGVLVEVTWFRDELNHAVSFNITKRKRSRETASLSKSWETLLDEVIKARGESTQCTWIIENDAADLLGKVDPQSIYLTVSANDPGMSKETLVPSSAQSKVSLAASENTLVSSPDESLTLKPQPSADTPGSPSLQVPRRGDASSTSLDTPQPGVSVTSSRDELPSTSGSTLVVPQISGDDDDIGSSSTQLQTSPIPVDIIHDQDVDPANDAVSPSTDVQQPSESDGAVRPSLKPDDTSPPLSETTVNTDQSPESPNTPQKGWFTRVKEVIVNTFTLGGTHEEQA